MKRSTRSVLIFILLAALAIAGYAYVIHQVAKFGPMDLP